MDSRDVLSVSEVAHRSGFAASALRYYESQGLIQATRSGGGQRRYERGVLRRLAFIRAAGNVGLTLDEIRTELERLPNGRPPTHRERSTSPGCSVVAGRPQPEKVGPTAESSVGNVRGLLSLCAGCNMPNAPGANVHVRGS